MVVSTKPLGLTDETRWCDLGSIRSKNSRRRTACRPDHGQVVWSPARGLRTVSSFRERHLRRRSSRRLGTPRDDRRVLTINKCRRRRIRRVIIPLPPPGLRTVFIAVAAAITRGSNT